MDGVKVTGYEYPYVNWTDSLGVDGRWTFAWEKANCPGELNGPLNGKFMESLTSPMAKITGQQEDPR